MSRRIPALATAGLLGLAGALLGAGSAHAEAAPTVTFTGGCGLLGVIGPHTHPDSAQISVVSMGSVRFVNGLNRAADLVLPGGRRYALGAGAALEVPIASGPAEALMEPQNCGLGLLPAYEKVTIAVTAAPPPPEPTQPPASPPGTHAPGTTPGSPQSPSANSGRPPATEGGTSPTGGAASPAATPGGPSQSPPQAAGAATTPGRSTPGAKAVQVAPDDQPLAVEAVSAGEVPGRASSLLALVATVCVIGVSAAAIRAIGAQRSIRTAVG